MAQWADASSVDNIEHSSLDVNLTDFGPNYDPRYDLEAKCPMCRTHTTGIPDQILAQRLEQKYPVAYAERRAEEEEVESGSRIGQDGIEGVMILIGNKHRLLRGTDDANQHDWTFFVRMSRPELVKHIRIDLHPTFRPPALTLRNPPFEVRRLGWGYFCIRAEIVLKEPYSWILNNGSTRQTGLELTWTLDFEGRGRQGRVRAKVKKIEEQLGRDTGNTDISLSELPQPVEDDDEDGDFDFMDGSDTFSGEDEDDADDGTYNDNTRR